MDNPHLRSAYILISFIMFMPVLFWLLPLLLYENPMLADTLKPTWFLSISLFLITSVSIDSILYGISSRKQSVIAVLWISMFAMIIMIALHNNNNYWLLAALFLLHSLRSGYPLFFNQKKRFWWLWLAWSRDTITPATIFIWSTAWSLP